MWEYVCMHIHMGESRHLPATVYEWSKEDLGVLSSHPLRPTFSFSTEYAKVPGQE